jgi:hypothetical protein
MKIHRISTTRFGRAALIGRGFNYLSFYNSACRSVLAFAKPGDVLVAKTDPPLLCIAARRAAKRRGLHLVNRLQDLYPDLATQLSVPLVKGPLGRGFANFATWRCVPPTPMWWLEKACRDPRARGIAPERIGVITELVR